MQRLIFGGSFNPIHHGHLICARAVAETLNYDRITLMPTGVAPHKQSAAMVADSADRLAMMRAAVAESCHFEVDDLELRRSGPSYTIDTAEILLERAAGPVHWLIGADMLMYLPKWHRAAELIQKVKFIVMARPGWSLDWQQLSIEFRHLQANVVKAPLIDISATTIRDRIAAGKPIDYLTPDAVCRYIKERGLYRRDV